jgi:hypothetical protein
VRAPFIYNASRERERGGKIFFANEKCEHEETERGTTRDELKIKPSPVNAKKNQVFSSIRESSSSESELSFHSSNELRDTGRHKNLIFG